MAIDRKLNQGITKLRDSVATEKSGQVQTVTTTETWVGPHALLSRKQQAAWKNCKSTSLAPGAADSGTLTLTRERKYEIPEDEAELPPPTVEVLWQELRVPVMQHPAFKDISPENKKKIREAAEKEDSVPPTNEVELKLYNLLAAGTTEYATGVPVIRRNTTQRKGDVGGGNAWVRANPPEEVEGTWEYMKTSDERRQEGETFTQVEEWTGAKIWDPVLYPGND